MHEQLVKLFKGTFIKQKLDEFASRQLAGSVLLLDARRAAALFSLSAALAQRVEFRFGLFGLLLRRHKVIRRTGTIAFRSISSALREQCAHSRGPRSDSRNGSHFHQSLRDREPG